MSVSMVKPAINPPNPPNLSRLCNGASMAQWAYATRWAKHAIGPQAKAQEAQDKAQDLWPIHTLDKIRAATIVLQKETDGLLDSIPNPCKES